MIGINDLDFAYSGQPFLFKELNLQINKNESWAVIGPSGCGKTTLLYLMAGLLKPTNGEILINLTPVVRPRPQTGLVLQDHGLLPWATVRENTNLGLRIRQFYGPDGKHSPINESTGVDTKERQVNYWLKRLGIDPLAEKYPRQISRGQRQRTAIARTMVMAPDLLLMDEPFSALDAVIRDDLRSLVMELHFETHLTSFNVTHDIEEAVFIGQKIIVLMGSSNKDFHIIDNPLAGKRDYRDQASFHNQCKELRNLMGGAYEKGY
ncbi:ABC transporter ATP-binding protein [Thermodesulfobacteriota bacterium]